MGRRHRTDTTRPEPRMVISSYSPLQPPLTVRPWPVVADKASCLPVAALPTSSTTYYYTGRLLGSRQMVGGGAVDREDEARYGNS